MEIKKSAVVGTLESSDIMITLNPSTAGRIDIQLESSVEKQFGNQIRYFLYYEDIRKDTQ